MLLVRGTVRPAGLVGAVLVPRVAGEVALAGRGRVEVGPLCALSPVKEAAQGLVGEPTEQRVAEAGDSQPLSHGSVTESHILHYALSDCEGDVYSTFFPPTALLLLGKSQEEQFVGQQLKPGRTELSVSVCLH